MIKIKDTALTAELFEGVWWLDGPAEEIKNYLSEQEAFGTIKVVGDRSFVLTEEILAVKTRMAGFFTANGFEEIATAYMAVPPSGTSEKLMKQTPTEVAMTFLFFANESGEELNLEVMESTLSNAENQKRAADIGLDYKEIISEIKRLNGRLIFAA